jgi:hypothetical protein
LKFLTSNRHSDRISCLEKNYCIWVALYKLQLPHNIIWTSLQNKFLAGTPVCLEKARD